MKLIYNNNNYSYIIENSFLDKIWDLKNLYVVNRTEMSNIHSSQVWLLCEIFMLKILFKDKLWNEIKSIILNTKWKNDIFYNNKSIEVKGSISKSKNLNYIPIKKEYLDRVIKKDDIPNFYINIWILCKDYNWISIWDEIYFNWWEYWESFIKKSNLSTYIK